MACLCQHFETEQDVVVPVVGIEQLEKIIADHSTIAETLKQLMLPETSSFECKMTLVSPQLYSS